MVTALRAIGRLVALTAPALVVLAVTLNGWSGLMPGVDFWDTGEFQVIGPVLGTGHSPGFPTYAILGFVVNLLLAPLGEPAFRMNVFSLLSVAAAAGCVFVMMRRLGVPSLIAAMAGFAMATTPLVWLQATKAEPHTLHLAFVAVLFLVLVVWEDARRAEMGAETAASASGGRKSDRWLLVGAALFGVSGGNHGLTFILFPAIALYVLAVDARTMTRFRLILACAVVSVGALALVYLELPLRAGPFRAPLVYGRPETWDGFWYVALATQFHGLISDPLTDLVSKAEDLAKLASAELGILAIFVPIGFAATIRQAPRYAVLSGSAMIITLFWNSFFNDGYIDRYYLGPIFWAWTWLAVLAAMVAERVSDLIAGPPRDEAMTESAGTDAPIPVRNSNARRVELAVAVVVAIALLLPSVSDWGRRSSAADRHADRGAQAWLDEVMPVFARDAVVVTWWSASTALWYGQLVAGRRPDIFIVDDRTMLDMDFGRAPDVIRRYLGQRPVYALRANSGDLAELTGQFAMLPVAGSGTLTVYLVTGELKGS